MKTTITISLLTSTILLAPNCAAASEDALSPTYIGEGRISHATPSTLEQLEAFLRKNWGPDFPEIGFSSFCLPFKPEFSKLKRIDRLRAQSAAIETLGQMVALGYCAFTQEIEGLKVKTPHFDDRAASRPEAMAHYKRFNHPHFLKFQKMIMQVLEFAQGRPDELGKDAKAALTQPYGSSDALGIAWLRDNTGIVPALFNGPLKRTIYSSSSPYGDWGDDLQRSMVFIDGKLIEAPGIHIYTENAGGAFKFVRENGPRDRFVTSPLTIRSHADHPIISTLIESGSLRVGLTPSTLGAFLTLPANPAEDKEFEAAFLEELLDAQREGGSPFEEIFLSKYLEALEDERINTAVEASPEVPKTILEKHIYSLYEELILAEQAEISRKVTEGSIAGKVKATKKGKAKHVAINTLPAQSNLDTETEEKLALRTEIFTRLKDRGRTKWRTLSRALIAALKSAYADKTIAINVTEKGSHFMLHVAGETSSGGATIIRPHGKGDRSISVGAARGLAENLIDLTFGLMTRR
jgi:hypothetical protein